MLRLGPGVPQERFGRFPPVPERILALDSRENQAQAESEHPGLGFDRVPGSGIVAFYEVGLRLDGTLRLWWDVILVQKPELSDGAAPTVSVLWCVVLCGCLDLCWEFVMKYTGRSPLLYHGCKMYERRETGIHVLCQCGWVSVGYSNFPDASAALLVHTRRWQ